MNNSHFSREWQQLEQATTYYQTLLNQQPLAVLQQSPAPGKWSALQVLEHLAGVETAAVQYLLRKNYTPLVARGLPAPLRAFMLQVALKSPLKFKVPPIEGLQPQNTSEPSALLERWQKTRQKLAAYVEALPADRQKSLLFVHPRAGALSLQHTLQFLADHLNHHRRQAAEALSRPTAISSKQ